MSLEVKNEGPRREDGAAWNRVDTWWASMESCQLNGFYTQLGYWGQPGLPVERDGVWRQIGDPNPAGES